MNKNVDLDRSLKHFGFERSMLFCVVLDDGGTILEANRYAQEITGRSLEGESFSTVLVDFSGAFDLSIVTEKAERKLLHITTGKWNSCSKAFSN